MPSLQGPASAACLMVRSRIALARATRRSIISCCAWKAARSLGMTESSAVFSNGTKPSNSYRAS
jgi:hypothetical protein